MAVSHESGPTTSEITDEIQETETGYLVSLPIATGFVRVAFESLEQYRSDDLKAKVTTWQEVSGLPVEPFSARLNILSLSQRESYRRNLDDAFGKGGWTKIVNRACSMVERAWQNRDRSVSLSEVSTNGSVPYLCEPLLVRGANVIFGKGDTGKTWLALALARSHITGEEVAGLAWEELGPALYVDYEADQSTLAGRCDLLGGRPKELRYWAAGGVPLADQLPALRTEIRRWGISFVVVDSAGLACGGEPERAEMAIRYFNALGALGVPSLTIAHLRKNGEKDDTPFGSVYWASSARQIWKATSEQEEGEREIGLQHMKWNNVPRKSRPIGLRMVSEGGVRFERCDFGELFEDLLSIPQRIRRELRHGGAEVGELAAELEVSEVKVKRALMEMGDVVWLDESNQWGLRDQRA